MLAGYAIVASGLPIPLGVDHGPRSAAAEKRLAGKDRSRPFPCMDKPCGCATAEQCFSNCCCNTPAETLAWARARKVDPAVIAALQRRVAVPAETAASASSCCSVNKDTTCCSAASEPACCSEMEAVGGSVSLGGPEICGDLLVIEKPDHVQNPESPSRKRGDRHDANVQGSIASLAATADERRANETPVALDPDSPEIEPMSSHTVTLKAMLACAGIVSQWLSVGGAPPPPVVVAVVSVAPLVEAILPGEAFFSCVRAEPAAPPPRVA